MSLVYLKKVNDNQSNKRMLIGFIAGLILSSGIGYLMLLVFNWALPWTGREPMAVTWGNVLPMGIVLGLGLSLVMRDPPFGD